MIRRAPSSSPPRDQLLDSREALPDPAPTITKSFLIKYFGFILFQSGPHILDANAFPSSYLMDSAIECVPSPRSLIIRLCSLPLGPLSLVIHSYSSEIDPLFLFFVPNVLVYRQISFSFGAVFSVMTRRLLRRLCGWFDV